MTPQTPPTDRPLTAGDVPLLRAGDLVAPTADLTDYRGGKQAAGVPVYIQNIDGHFIRTAHPEKGHSCHAFTFVSRPATSAASEVAPFAEGGIGHAMQERGHAYLNDYVLSTDGADYEPNEFERSLLEDFMSGLLCDEAMFGPVRALLAQQAALASPPVSERPALTVWYGSMPESNGRENWTAELRRVNPTDKWSQGFCFARSEYPGRVLYEADRMRWIIGERAERPDILAYDADTHSDYVPPVSERERELEGALADLLSWFTKPVQGEHGMVWVIRAGEQGADDAIKAAKALTAQPAGEGK